MYIKQKSSTLQNDSSDLDASKSDPVTSSKNNNYMEQGRLITSELPGKAEY